MLKNAGPTVGEVSRPLTSRHVDWLQNRDVSPTSSRTVLWQICIFAGANSTEICRLRDPGFSLNRHALRWIDFAFRAPATTEEAWLGSSLALSGVWATRRRLHGLTRRSRARNRCSELKMVRVGGVRDASHTRILARMYGYIERKRHTHAHTHRHIHTHTHTYTYSHSSTTAQTLTVEPLYQPCISC